MSAWPWPGPLLRTEEWRRPELGDTAPVAHVLVCAGPEAQGEAAEVVAMSYAVVRQLLLAAGWAEVGK